MPSLKLCKDMEGHACLTPLPFCTDGVLSAVCVCFWSPGDSGACSGTLTHGKLHQALVVLAEHVEEQVQHLQLPEVLVVAGIVGEVGQVRQHLLLGLCKGKGSGV